MLSQRLAGWALAGAMAPVILFESSTRCDIMPSVEADLAARYEREAYGDLAVAYPGEDPQQLRMLASNVVKGLTGRAGQWGNQQNDR